MDLSRGEKWALGVGLGLFGVMVSALAWPKAKRLLGAVGSSSIVQTVGKHWILSNKAGPGTAVNYGWHFQADTFEGGKYEPSVSLPGVRCIQGVGTRHNAGHVDYSQTVVLARQDCVYRGEARRLSELLQDPDASEFLSVEGPLQSVRQPGVAPWDGVKRPSSVGSVSRDMVAALPDSIADREAILLSWVDEGLGEYQWAAVTTGELTFYVFADALKFGGVRINATATLEQQIADHLDASLLTARMADLVYAAASRVILPRTFKASAQMSSTAAMVDESDAIDAALGA